MSTGDAYRHRHPFGTGQPTSHGYTHAPTASPVCDTHPYSSSTRAHMNASMAHSKTQAVFCSKTDGRRRQGQQCCAEAQKTHHSRANTQGTYACFSKPDRPHCCAAAKLPRPRTHTRARPVNSSTAASCHHQPYNKGVFAAAHSWPHEMPRGTHTRSLRICHTRMTSCKASPTHSVCPSTQGPRLMTASETGLSFHDPQALPITSY